MFYCFLFFLCWRRPLDIGPKYSNRFCWFTVLGKKSSLFSLLLLFHKVQITPESNWGFFRLASKTTLRPMKIVVSILELAINYNIFSLDCFLKMYHIIRQLAKLQTIKRMVRYLMNKNKRLVSSGSDPESNFTSELADEFIVFWNRNRTRECRTRDNID